MGESIESAMRKASEFHQRFGSFSDPPEDEYGEDIQKRQFCLSCGATHFSAICPFCESDAQDDL